MKPKHLEYTSHIIGGEIQIDFKIGVPNAVPTDTPNDIEALKSTIELLNAAPGLLEALERIVNLQDAGWSAETLPLKIRETALRAIAKAKGETK